MSSGVRRLSSKWAIGVDLGQVQDHTALCAVQSAEFEDRSVRDPVTFGWRTWKTMDVRHVQRLPLGLPYPVMVERIARLVERVQRVTVHGQRPDPVELVLDATGVGAAVVELVLPLVHCPVHAVTITATGRAAKREQGRWSVPKADLVGAVATALQTGWLRIGSAVPQAQELTRELLAMTAKITPAGNRQFEAAAGSHDDLVLAVALAVWRLNVPKAQAIEQGVPLPFQIVGRFGPPGR